MGSLNSALPEPTEGKKEKKYISGMLMRCRIKQDRAVSFGSFGNAVQNIGYSSMWQRNPPVDTAHLISDSLKSHQNKTVDFFQDCLLTMSIKSY